MKIYTKDQLFGEIYLNKDTKFTSTQWEEDKFITQKDGQIIDQDGNPFNLMTAKDEEWIVWVEPKPTQNTATITKEEALKALYNGKRVKALSWDDKALEVKDGQILLNDKTPFNIMTSKEKDWVLIEECKDSQNESQQIAELKAMLEKVLAQNVNAEAKYTDGRSTEAQANTADLLKEVYGVSTPKEIQIQFKEKLESATSTWDIEKTVCEYIPYCWIGGRTLGTTSVYYTNMREVITKLKNETYRDTALNLFLPPQKLYESVQTKISDNKKEVIRDKNTFNAKYIKSLIKMIKEKIIKDDYSDKPRRTDLEREKAYWAYAYLTIVTGRRQTEILKTLEIKKAKGVWQYCGILKDREDGKCIDAYALDDDFEFLSDLVDYIQEHTNAKAFTEKQINSKYNKSFNDALKRITGKDYKSHEWRSIYTELMLIKENKSEANEMDKKEFKAKILGHHYKTTLTATEHYDGWETI